ncbi:four helix bundle protein [Chryseobacterium sp. MP_3.2]|uniref:four helix bundle protein n=1 Tax=Chryseobacterium sp. MP_3.2 TaxID=3071712 RepID=UPI002E094ABF|nr:four helix bundle protein [Chryseobacterium sp. MP_3.2]
MNNHKDLLVYQKSLDLVEMIYRETRAFPAEEKFGLISQLRRCSVSLPSNTAEGAGRKGTKEFIQFLYIALGSLNEMETQMEISRRLGFVNDLTAFTEHFLHIKRMLLKLIEKLEGK